MKKREHRTLDGAWPPPGVRAKLATLQQRVKDTRAAMTKASERVSSVHKAKPFIELGGQDFEATLASAKRSASLAERAWLEAKQALREFAENELRAGRALVQSTFAELVESLSRQANEAAQAAAKLLDIFDSVHSELESKRVDGAIESKIARIDSAAADWNNAVNEIPELSSFTLRHSLRSNVAQIFTQNPALRLLYNASVEFRAKLDAASRVHK